MEDERTVLWANYQNATDNLHSNYRTANTPTNFYRGMGGGTECGTECGMGVGTGGTSNPPGRNVLGVCWLRQGENNVSLAF